MTDDEARSTEGRFIIQSSFGAGPWARKYRGRPLNCLRAYAALSRKEARRMSVTVWRLGEGGGFELFPGPPEKDGQWVVEPFTHDEMKPVEDPGPVYPRS